MFLLNGKPVKFGQFPNGELNMDKKWLDVKHYNSIQWDYEGDGDIMKLIVLKGYIDQTGTEARLNMTYLPYSRMDRVNDEYVFTLKTFCKFINGLNFEKITVREAHSNAIDIALDRCWKWSWIEPAIDVMREGFLLDKYDTIMFPDAGALVRYKKLDIGDKNIVIGSKVRDFKSGNIESYSIVGDVTGNVLIVDDLCSRGGTFIEASVELKKVGAEEVDLIVCHCEKNVFTGKLFDHIETLFTSPEMLRNAPYHDQIKFLEIENV
jgi:ribose-phosphate pyrophosphokinase